MELPSIQKDQKIQKGKKKEKEMIYFRMKYEIVKGETYNDTPSNFISESNTIEDLCDGYEFELYGKPVATKYKNDYFYGDDEWESNIQRYREDKKYGGVLRFFIRTDKGLLYVAKMNDKGDLELL